MYRSLKEVTKATVPLFTTAEAKDFLKVDTTADDTLIDNLIIAATESCQIYTNQYFIKTVVEQYGDTWAGIYTLYKSPVLEVEHIKYYDTENSIQELSDTTYEVDNVSKPARIGLVGDDQTLPNIYNKLNAVVVNYNVGYGSAASDVPDGIKQAVLLTLGNWYENRQSVISGRTATELPLSSQYLLDQYKIQVC